MGRVRSGHYYFIIFFDPTQTRSDYILVKKMLTHIRPDRIMGRSDPIRVK
jgi:hypothetical protein